MSFHDYDLFKKQILRVFVLDSISNLSLLFGVIDFFSFFFSKAKGHIVLLLVMSITNYLDLSWSTDSSYRFRCPNFNLLLVVLGFLVTFELFLATLFFVIGDVLNSKFFMCFVYLNNGQLVPKLDCFVASLGIFQSSPGCRGIKS